MRELSKEDLCSMIAKGIVEHAKTSDELTAVKAELRKAIADTKRERDEARKKEVYLRGPDLSVLGPDFATLPTCVREYIADIETRCDPAGDLRKLILTRDENLALLASLAEMTRKRDELREAVLGIGKLWFVGEYLESDSEVLRHTDIQRHNAIHQHNALVAKLCAEAKEETKQ